MQGQGSGQEQGWGEGERVCGTSPVSGSTAPWLQRQDAVKGAVEDDPAVEGAVEGDAAIDGTAPGMTAHSPWKQLLRLFKMSV